MKEISFIQKLLFYLSNMLPTFVAIALIYDFPFTLSSSTQEVALILSLIPIVVSLVRNLLYKRLIPDSLLSSDSSSECQKFTL